MTAPPIRWTCPVCNAEATGVDYEHLEITTFGDASRRYVDTGVRTFWPCGCVDLHGRAKPTGWEDLADLISEAEANRVAP